LELLISVFELFLVYIFLGGRRGGVSFCDSSLEGTTVLYRGPLLRVNGRDSNRGICTLRRKPMSHATPSNCPPYPPFALRTLTIFVSLTRLLLVSSCHPNRHFFILKILSLSYESFHCPHCLSSEFFLSFCLLVFLSSCPLILYFFSKIIVCPLCHLFCPLYLLFMSS
jgi:hypothetical protein